jgi:excisionase family DNA binding protein
MIRQSVTTNRGPGGNHADGGPDPTQNAYWDLDLLTPDDVCALLKVKKSWLYDAVENGAIEAIRLGKQLRFRPSALISYLEEHASKVNGHQRS